MWFHVLPSNECCRLNVTYSAHLEKLLCLLLYKYATDVGFIKWQSYASQFFALHCVTLWHCMLNSEWPRCPQSKEIHSWVPWYHCGQSTNNNNIFIIFSSAVIKLDLSDACVGKHECLDLNAECRQGACRCLPTFYERGGICRKCVYFLNLRLFFKHVSLYLQNNIRMTTFDICIENTCLFIYSNTYTYVLFNLYHLKRNYTLYDI